MAALVGRHQAYEGPWSDLVYHSGRVLQGLTTSPRRHRRGPHDIAPEDVGRTKLGLPVRLDPRRLFTLNALWGGACPDEVDSSFSWMTGAVASQIRRANDLQIMFGVGGERDLSERTVPHLAAGAAPALSASATEHGTSGSSTCTASCWTRPPGSPTSCRAWTTRREGS